MRPKLPLILSVMALIVAFGFSPAGPAVAHGVRHALFAHNADKVDGKHAVGAAATVNNRKGALVATSPTTGQLPNNIIAKAPDANQLDGLDSTAFLRSNAAAAGDLTGTYPNPSIAGGAVTADKLAANVGLGFFTGRLNDLNPTQPSAGVVSGLSQATASTDGMETLSPSQEIRLADFAARLTADVEAGELLAVSVEALDDNGVGISGVSCIIGPGANECTAAGPSVTSVPPRSPLVLRITPLPPTSLPLGTDLLFSWRAQTS